MANVNDQETIPTTEETILNSLEDGDDNAQSSISEGTGDEDTGTTTRDQGTTSEASSGKGTDGSGNKEQERKETRDPNDLVDREGNVVAKAGVERRHFETAQREKVRADSATRENETLRAQLEAINEAGNVGTQYSLTPEEVTTGAQLIASYKKNPVETLQYLLTQAQGNGHNIEGITSGGMDMSAVKQMLDTALAPLVGDRQERIDTQALEDEAIGIYNSFMSLHPDASVHEDSIARLMENDPGLTPEAAYYKLQSYYAQRNLDWTKNLETLQAEIEANRGSGGNTPQPPEGGSVPVNNVTDTAGVADVNVSFDDIIRDAISEAGVN